MATLHATQINYLNAKAAMNVAYEEFNKRTTDFDYDNDFDNCMEIEEDIRTELHIEELHKILVDAEDSLMVWSVEQGIRHAKNKKQRQMAKDVLNLAVVKKHYRARKGIIELAMRLAV